MPSTELTRSDPRTNKARLMRKSMTLEERIVWSQLKQLDIKGHFRRQVPIGKYFADFAHLGAKLIVEIDGSQHGSINGMAHDTIRTVFLESIGFRVLRFWNNEILSNRDGVIETILAALHQELESFAPHPKSLPTAMRGEGLYTCSKSLTSYQVSIYHEQSRTTNRLW
jgi:very-short-patch-repair endonuclease